MTMFIQSRFARHNMGLNTMYLPAHTFKTQASEMAVPDIHTYDPSNRRWFCPVVNLCYCNKNIKSKIVWKVKFIVALLCIYLLHCWYNLAFIGDPIMPKKLLYAIVVGIIKVKLSEKWNSLQFGIHRTLNGASQTYCKANWNSYNHES